MSCAEGCCVTKRTQTETQPNGDSDYAAGFKDGRALIAKQLKDLPGEAPFYPSNILKILKLD